MAHTPCAQRPRTHVRLAAASSLIALATYGLSTPAHAVDGCQVLLCFAAPNWRGIPECVPPVRQVLRDLARGRGFPTCSMASSGGSTANHRWASAPTNCPPQYTRLVETDTGSYYSCDYSGVVSVRIDGQTFADTWWNMAGDTVTSFSPSAKSQLGSWDTRYDEDLSAWQAAQAAQAAALAVDPGQP
jgi:hypothetical protein